MTYADIHCHILSGVDDGAKTPDIMYRMLDTAYADGVRALCATPHFYPEIFGDNAEKSQRTFQLLRAYAEKKYPDMTLSLGNELGYHLSWRAAVLSGACRLIGDRYLLVDFPADRSYYELCYAMNDLISVGIPIILAHTERYLALYNEYDQILDWCHRGVLLQINASAFFKKRPLKHRLHVKRLISRCPIAMIASDGHNMGSRLPVLSHVAEYVTKKYGEDRASFWLWGAPNRILQGKKL